jgi:hypothetical protein
MDARLDCRQAETLLAEYIEGDLRAADREAVAAHVATCGACGAMVEDMRFAYQRLRSAETLPLPPQLVSRILERTTGQTPAGVPAWRHRLLVWINQTLKPWLGPVLEPRFAMGLAMTAVSLTMVINVLGVDLRQIELADFRPSAIYQNLERQTVLTAGKVRTYYSNLRLVYEIQSQLQSLREDPAATPQKPEPAQKTNEQEETPAPPQRQEDRKKLNNKWTRQLTLLAMAVRGEQPPVKSQESEEENGL